MYLRASTWFSLGGLAFALVLATGCDGGSSGPGTDGGFTRPDGSGFADTSFPPGTGGPGRDGGAPTIDAIGPVAPPAIQAGSVKILPAGSRLLGGITVGCSYGPASTAAGTRWCAFGRPGAQLGRWELWVLNMNKAGEPTARCEGASTADCIRLTDDLFGAAPQVGPTFPSAHRFYGDTLVYHANAKSAASQAYSGPIYAWQPGWTAPKKISSTDSAFRCVGHARASVALCLEDLKVVEGQPLTFTLTAGKIDGTAPASTIAKILPFHPVEVDSSQWGAGFTMDGKYLLYSTGIAPVPPETIHTPETLYYIETDKIGVAGETPKQVGGAGVSAWDVSPDGTKWFFLRDYNYSPEAPSGTLWTADFPTGDNPVKLASPLIKDGNTSGVAAYDLVLTKDLKLAWVSIVQNYARGLGEYVLLKNPAGSLVDPTNVVKIRDDIANFPINSPDLRYGRYFMAASTMQPGITDARILKNDGTPGCTLTASISAALFGAPFTENAGLTFWIENYNPDSDTGDGMVASPADCITGKRRFGTNVDYWFIKGDEQMVYTDTVVNDRTATLRLAPISGGTLGAGTEIQRQVERFFQVLPNQEGVIFHINSGSSAMADGLYYRKLGVTTPTGDAGAPDAGVDASADATAGN